MVKRVSTFSFTNEEKAFIKKLKHEATSKTGDKVMEEGGEIDKVFSLDDNDQYRWSWRNFVSEKGKEITDINGKIWANSHVLSGVIIRQDEIARRNSILAAYFAPKLFRAFEESGFTLEDIDTMKDNEDNQKKLSSVIDGVLEDFRKTEAGDIVQKFVWRLWVLRKQHENDNFWNDLRVWAGYSKTHDDIKDKPTYEKVTRLMGYYKSAFKIPRIAFLEGVSAPKIIMVNEYRQLSEYLYFIFADIVGATGSFEDEMGWTIDGVWVGTKDDNTDDNLPDLAEDQPVYDEEGNPIIYEWDKEEEKWVNVGIMPAIE